ncbi:Mov34/MPN/PAD-1 family protein [Pseudomonas sp. W15-Feb18]|nr:Mov34/MPN/PAD-1 family protein [Pseudomonas arcuscaelestis]
MTFHMCSINPTDFKDGAVRLPAPKDQRLKYLIERLLHGHRRIAEKRWKDSNRLIRCLGEWHTHPEDFPAPSGLDINEWKRACKGCQDDRLMLAAIVGQRDLRIHELIWRTKTSIASKRVGCLAESCRLS